MRAGCGGFRGAACALLLGLAACGGGEGEGNFSQYPGMKEMIPRLEQVPEVTPAGRRMLERYQPVFRVGAGEDLPLDFYRDYIAHGDLYDGQGRKLGGPVSQALLNRHARDPLALFVHVPERGADPVRPVVYGRIDRGRQILGGREVALVFLTWHLAFRDSGIVGGLGSVAAFLLELVGDLDDWHQLDHYTAVTLTFLEGQDRPFAVTFQQHNYARTYRLGGRPGAGRLAWPDSGRIDVDIALRSNELYPHRPGRTERRSVGFMTESTMEYLITGTGGGMQASTDITDSAVRLADLELVTLPPQDAFYTFRGWLGERRSLPGRDGPPGANYATLPALLPWERRVFAFYWHEQQQDWQTRFRDVKQGDKADFGWGDNFVQDWGPDAPWE